MDDYCTQYYYPILDRVLAEMQSRFSNLSLSLMNSVQACLSKSYNFLDAMSLQPLIEHYNIENTSLPVEFLQAKSSNNQRSYDYCRSDTGTITFKSSFSRAYKVTSDLIDIGCQYCTV